MAGYSQHAAQTSCVPLLTYTVASRSAALPDTMPSLQHAETLPTIYISHFLPYYLSHPCRRCKTRHLPYRGISLHLSSHLSRTKTSRLNILLQYEGRCTWAFRQALFNMAPNKNAATAARCVQAPRQDYLAHNMRACDETADGAELMFHRANPPHHTHHYYYTPPRYTPRARSWRHFTRLADATAAPLARHQHSTCFQRRHGQNRLSIAAALPTYHV